MPEPSWREFAPEPWDEKEGSYGEKLFHREERPSPERNIIDTSERARANYRYVGGLHFWLLNNTNQFSEVAILAKNLSVCICQIIRGVLCCM